MKRKKVLHPLLLQVRFAPFWSPPKFRLTNFGPSWKILEFRFFSKKSRQVILKVFDMHNKLNFGEIWVHLGTYSQTEKEAKALLFTHFFKSAFDKEYWE